MKANYNIRTIEQLNPGDTIKCSFLGSDQVIKEIDLKDSHAILETGLKYYGLNGQYLVLTSSNNHTVIPSEAEGSPHTQYHQFSK